jgi:hypothetical protein
MTSLTDLIERVEGATGELDNETLGRVICVAYGVEFGSADDECGDDGSEAISIESADEDYGRVWSGYRHRAPDVSLDAALALCERVLPGLWWNVGVCSADPLTYSADFSDGTEEPGPTPALALILAMLKALQAKEATP